MLDLSKLKKIKDNIKPPKVIVDEPKKAKYGLFDYIKQILEVQDRDFLDSHSALSGYNQYAINLMLVHYYDMAILEAIDKASCMRLSDYAHYQYLISCIPKKQSASYQNGWRGRKFHSTKDTDALLKNEKELSEIICDFYPACPLDRARFYARTMNESDIRSLQYIEEKAKVKIIKKVKKT